MVRLLLSAFWSSAVCTSLLAGQQPLNILCYGNSYSLDNGRMALLGLIAGETGRPANVVTRLVGGTDLHFHLTDPAQAAAITTALPAGQFWDFVVVQGMSTEATVRLGNPAAFRANAQAIVRNVRAHSPAAKAVLFQTWARARTDPFYPFHFASPVAMHAEVRANYQLAADDINTTFGPDTARVARVGDGIALLGFDPAYYHADRSHPGESMTLLAAMSIYTAIWGDTLCDVSPDFTSQSPLARFFAAYGFKASSWSEMKGYGELIAERALRRFPGSSEDLLVRSGAQGGVVLSVCSSVDAVRGGNLVLELATPNAAYGTVPAALLLDRLASGPQPGLPELFVGAAALPLAVSPVLGGALRLTLAVPLRLPVASLLVQGVALGPSRARNNPLFTTTDGLEVRVR